MWRIEFTSDLFLPVLPEECQTNPGAYGFELALWLARALLKRGIVTSYPISEDWGWLIEHTDAKEHEFTLGCSSLADADQGYTGQPVRWSVFVRPHLSVGERLRGVTRREQVLQLGAHIVAALKEAGIEVSPVAT